MEWLKEEDYYSFEVEGYTCEIKRHSSMKHLCGYVHLKSNDKYYDCHYEDIDVLVHGGLTYSEYRDSNWVIGFDCAHSGDLVPTTYLMFKDTYLHSNYEVYRTVEYVTRELNYLVAQITTN